MLEKLSEGLRSALRKITGAGYVDKGTLDELVRDIQRTLISGDVDVKMVFALTETIKKRALTEKPPAGMSAREHVVRIVYEELVKFVGKKPEILLKPHKVLFVGLYGSGKTTSIGKLARFYQKKGLKVALVGCDVHRPAAMTQLEQIASQIGVPVFAPKDVKDPYKVALAGIEQFGKKYDVLIFDASGRSALDPELAEELKKLGEIIKADEVLLTIPADLGQAAGPQAKAFKELVGITGIFLTKMDATARGGGAITACAVTGAPVKFIGIGEKLEAIEIFDPERFISRLIGFGDLQSLLEKVKEAEFKPEAAKAMMEGKFTMGDFYEQIKAMQKMGPLKSVLESMPGMGMMKLPKEFDPSVMEGKMKKWKYMIESMTKAEKADPDIIDSSRIKRIAKGSGTTEADVRELLKYYTQIKKMTKMLTGGGMKRGLFATLAKRFRGLG
ncbi:MAG: signal recognition particle receptor subunit alpha [Candidatus Aenigmatarchaeota archaeon]